MDKKKLVGVVVAVVLAAVAYFWGQDAVTLVKESLKSEAPITTETAPEVPAK